ncbi:MAG TPA: CsbD family protein [Streptosporangiaceae bacterium]
MQINAGRARARYGRATGNRSLEVKARRQRIVGATRQVGEQLKDSGRNIRAALK